MKIVIGIDVGISTTKIVGINEQGNVVSPIRIRATDPVTSLYGAFGKYLHDNHIQLGDVEKVMLTGVGSAYINEPVYGLPTDKAEEFLADGLGARYDIKHIGGIGIGGGTLQGLSRLLLKTDDIKQVAALAEEGDLSHINVLIKDICANPLQGLPMDAIASLFGNAKTNASREDIALGLIWMVLQSICSATILSSLGSGIKEFVMIGNLTLLPQVRHVFPATERLYGVKFRIPRYSEFCTAIGAALCYLNVHKPTL